MDNPIYKNSVTKITIISLVLSLLCATAIIVAGTLFYYNVVILSLSETATVAALHTSGFVDIETLENVINDDCDESWLELQILLDMILDASPDLIYLYIMVAYDDERFQYIATGNLWEFRGFIEEPDVYSIEAWTTLRTGEITATTTPADAGDWGVVIAGFVPLKNEAGEVIAVLGADIDVSALYMQVFEFAVILAILSILLLFIMNFVLRFFILSVLEKFTEKLIEAERLSNVSIKKSESKTRFLAKMSHEIRTPMNVILGLTELQLQKGSFPKEVRDTFLQIYRSSKLLLDLINDILDYSKVELGKMEIANSSYDLYSIIVSTLQLNMIYLGDKHIKFEVNMHKDQYIELIGDSLRIRQVLNNLLSNAFKYTKTGSITFSIVCEELVESDEVFLIFTIEDTGIGMSQEQVERISSDEYVRFTSDNSANIEGTGLGMAISFQLVSLMGGSLEIKSELGVGTVFTFKVKQKKHTDERLGAFRAKKLKILDYDMEFLESISQVDYHSLSHSSILVVDDILSNLVVIKEMLLMYGIQVDTANCGVDAIHLVNRRKAYDIIFMDYMMPGMNGIEVMQELRASGYDKPIIVLTADITNNNKQLFIDNGFDGFLSKPVDIHELDSCLKRFVGGVKEVDETNKQFSEHLITSFLTDAKRESEYLCEMLKDHSFDEKKFEDFRIRVHGLKSACANVGLVELSAFAFRLEIACKDRNLQVLTTHSPIFLTKIDDAIIKFSQDNTSHKEVSLENIDVEFFRSKLLQLAEECEVYNAKIVKKTLAQMAAMECTSEIRSFLTEVRQLLLHSDYEVIGEKARSFAEGL